MRVLQVHNRYREAGGEDTVVDSEATVLRAAGHKVMRHQADNPVGVTRSVGKLALSPWNPAAARDVLRAAELFRPDVAHVHNTWFALSPAVVSALSRAGVPTVMTLHNYRLMCSNALLFRDGRPCELCVDSHPWHGVLHRCYRASAAQSAVAATGIAWHRARDTWQRHVDLFLALSEFSRERFIRDGLAGERVRVKPNFVADPGPRPAPPGQSGTLLFVGRLTPEKGPQVLLDAWERARPPSDELLIVGDGPLRPQLERRAVEGVRVVGPVPRAEVGALMRQARALLFPSWWYENQPMVLLEALSHGLPVIATDIGAVPETLDGLGREWLVPPDSPRAWEAAIRDVTRTEAEQDVDRAGARARAVYERRYQPSRGLGLLEDAYHTVASPAPTH